jgi:hypothetical protein
MLKQILDPLPLCTPQIPQTVVGLNPGVTNTTLQLLHGKAEQNVTHIFTAVEAVR